MESSPDVYVMFLFQMRNVRISVELCPTEQSDFPIIPWNTTRVHNIAAIVGTVFAECPHEFAGLIENGAVSPYHVYVSKHFGISIFQSFQVTSIKVELG